MRNRNRPELLFDEPQVKAEEASATKEKIPVVNLTDERKIRQEELLAAQARWQAAKKAIQENNITPKIEKNDERNIAIANRAKGKAYGMMTFVYGALMVSFALMGIDMIAVLLLVFAYLFVHGFALYYRFKFDKEM